MSTLTLPYRSLFDANRRLFDLFGVIWVGLDTTSVRHLERRCLHPYSWSVIGSFLNFLRRISYWVGYGLNVHGPLCSGPWNLVGSTVVRPLSLLPMPLLEAGAIALTAVAHTQLCQPLSACDLVFMGGSAYHKLIGIFTSSSSCVSTQVLQAFTWLSALLRLYHLPRHLGLF
jgi:hypothetical protein